MVVRGCVDIVYSIVMGHFDLVMLLYLCARVLDAIAEGREFIFERRMRL